MTTLQHTTSPAFPPDPYADDPLNWTYVVFRYVPGYPGYGIDTLGNVWSCHRRGQRGRIGSQWRRLKPVDSRGYKVVNLVSLDGSHVLNAIHSLVLTVFVGPPPPGCQACHYDGDKSNNSLRNLRWDTSHGNHLDSMRHDVLPKGSRHPNSKITEGDVIEIRRLVADGVSQTEVGRRFGLHVASVHDIVKGRNWAHIREGIRPVRRRRS